MRWAMICCYYFCYVKGKFLEFDFLAHRHDSVCTILDHVEMMQLSRDSDVIGI